MLWGRSMAVALTAGVRSCSISSAAAVTTSPLFTYRFSHNHKQNRQTLYVPLTSFCNAVTLPQTRGPNFVVPSEVVAALCRVRDAECGTEQWKHWCLWLDYQDTPQKLPPASEDSCVASIPIPSQRPTVQELVDEVHVQVSGKPNVDWNIIVAGEGEPTLRLDALMELIHRLTDVLRHQCHGSSCLRITTNGLVDSIGTKQLLEACTMASSLETSGSARSVPAVTLSVALMTHDADQYNQLMQPLFLTTEHSKASIVSPHDRVIAFIRQALSAGIDVETTAVERSDVDQTLTNQLSASLGVVHPVRWRPYFS
jgi:hypothetical protein